MPSLCSPSTMGRGWRAGGDLHCDRGLLITQLAAEKAIGDPYPVTQNPPAIFVQPDGSGGAIQRRNGFRQQGLHDLAELKLRGDRRVDIVKGIAELLSADPSGHVDQGVHQTLYSSASTSDRGEGPIPIGYAAPGLVGEHKGPGEERSPFAGVPHVGKYRFVLGIGEQFEWLRPSISARGRWQAAS